MKDYYHRSYTMQLANKSILDFPNRMCCTTNKTYKSNTSKQTNKQTLIGYHLY